jgi:hypothetical protein
MTDAASSALTFTRRRSRSSIQRSCRSWIQPSVGADVLDLLGVTTHPKHSRIHAHRRHHRIGVEGVAGVTDLVGHAILQEPMHQDYVRPAQVLAAGDVLSAETAVVGDELQVEARDEDAGVAVAAGRPVGRVLTAPEGEVRGVEGVEQHRGVDPVPGHVDEDGVALELAELHCGRRGAHDRVGQVLEDVLGMVELGSCEVRRVAADVGEGKAARLGLPNRRTSRAGRARHPLSLLPQMPAAWGSVMPSSPPATTGQSGAQREVADDAGDKNLPGAGECHDARGEVDAQPAHVAT